MRMLSTSKKAINCVFTICVLAVLLCITTISSPADIHADEPQQNSAYTGERQAVPFEDKLKLKQVAASQVRAAGINNRTLFALWNGFLEMANILELVNKGATSLSVTVTFYNIQGTQTFQQTLTIAAHSQQDVILNNLQGFSANSYGIVQIDYRGNNLDGRLSFYRYASNGSSYEFAFAVPFNDTIRGNSSVGFNTYQPSQNQTEASDTVAQWLSIVNLDSAQSKSFTVYRYNQSGTLLSSGDYSVEPYQRLDIEAGHVNPGASSVGLHLIVPQDAGSPYLAHLVRYGERTSSAGYAFAFPLAAMPGYGLEQWVTISNGGGAANWLELMNAGGSSASIAVTFYNNSGVTIWSGTLSLAAYAQQHLDVSSYLGSGISGAAKIAPTSADSKIVAQSMFYFRNAAGNIEAMYGSRARPVDGGAKTGSYNLYLEMYNWLRVFNTSSTAQSISLVVVDTNGQRNEHTISLGAYSGTDLGLHETSTFGTATNTFGLIEASGPVIAEVLRLRPTASGGVDFAMPTSVHLVKQKILPPENGCYLGMFPGWGEDEDTVNGSTLTAFEQLVGKGVAFTPFSNFWAKNAGSVANLEEVTNNEAVSLLRLFPWDEPYFGGETGYQDAYSLQRIIDGEFDTFLRARAEDVREHGAPVMATLGVEMNGNWFPWSGVLQGGATTDGYGDPTKADGPEKYVDAYRHAVNIFREEGVANVTWYFHPNYEATPDEAWNALEAYYPGDDYIDWVATSVYGAQYQTDDWNSFDTEMSPTYDSLLALAPSKPMLVAEWGVAEFPALGDKADWYTEALQTLQTKYTAVKIAVVYNESWTNEDTSVSDLRVNSSAAALSAYQTGIASDYFMGSVD